MPLPFPDDITKGRSLQPFRGGLHLDFSPVVTGCKAAEDIGFDPEGIYTAADYPKAPEVEVFNMLMMTGDLQVKKMILGTGAGSWEYAKTYAGFSETTARNGDPIACRVAGMVYLPVSKISDVIAGDLVAVLEDGTNGEPGDIQVYIDPAEQSDPVGANCTPLGAFVGRAVKGGLARVDEDNFDLALVVLRGY